MRVGAPYLLEVAALPSSRVGAVSRNARPCPLSAGLLGAAFCNRLPLSTALRASEVRHYRTRAWRGSPSTTSGASRARAKSTHIGQDARAPRPSDSLVRPKPSYPRSATGDDGFIAPPHDPLAGPSPDSTPGTPSTPVGAPPPRLVRYERLPDGSIVAAWQAPGPGQSSAPALAVTSLLRARISDAAKPRPASLFSFHPTATATSAHPLQDAPAPEDTMAKGGSVRKRASAANVNGKAPAAKDAHAHDHSHAHSSAHSHSHGLFGHSHDHHHEGSAEEADKLLAALKGKGDRGSNITVVGLASNVALCASKGVAGVYLHSAALLADAAHSFSDMFADLVTLFCWKMSQKPPSASHPLGYGKYETMGSLGVSVVLVAGAVGIGLHSYGLLLEALAPTLQNAPRAIQAIGHFTGSIASAGAHLHDHGAGEAAHGHEHGLLDPNAMWFALLSVVVKEWLYWATLKIAREENSSVLEANALHHRSDSLSSGVTFLAIGGSWLGFPVLDPLGGLLVAGLIGKQGLDLLLGALAELSDRGVDAHVLQSFDAALARVQEQLASSGDGDGAGAELLGWKDLRAVKSGVSTFVDVTLLLAPDTRLRDARKVELAVRKELQDAVKGVKEVRVHLDTSDGAAR